jgi:hypothetical protein
MTPTDTLQLYSREVAAIAAAGNELAVQAEALVITDDDADAAAKTVLATVTKGLKTAEDRRKELKAPALAECKAIDDAFKTALAPWAGAKTTIAQKTGTYYAEKKRLEDEQRREAERIEREAASARRKAEEEAAAAGAPPPPPPTPEPVAMVESIQSVTRTDAGTVGMVEKRDWELVDVTAVPRDYFILDTARIGKEIRAGGAIPGIKVVISYVPRTR